MSLQSPSKPRHSRPPIPTFTNHNNASLSHLPQASPTSPTKTRTIRRLQSHQTLSSTSGPSLIAQQRQQQRELHQQLQARSHSRDDLFSTGFHGNGVEQTSTSALNTTSAQHILPPERQRRPRSNSDAVLLPMAPSTTAAATGSTRPKLKPRQSTGERRSDLDNLIRSGPPNGDLDAGLNKLRYEVLSERVSTESDGMSSPRVYLWLILLNIPPTPTDTYLNYVHRGRSPAYAKIRNDTFRTLATDPLFKRRVTETSLIRLLNAVAWKMHDTRKAERERSRPRRPTTSDGNTHSGGRSPEHRRSIVAPPPRLTSFTAEDLESEAGELTESTSDTNSIYIQGMNVLSAPCLYASKSEVQAFALFNHIITNELPGYTSSTLSGVHKGCLLVDKVLAVVEPKLSSYLLSKHMHAEVYAFASVMTLSACTPPLPEVLHLWDFLFAYGAHLNILCIVAQLIRMRDLIMQSPSPTKVLRNLPPLEAKEIISLTLVIVKKIPKELYDEVVWHAK